LPTRETTEHKQQQVTLPRGPSAVSPEVVAANQRRRLLDALPVVVAEHGFEGTTVDQIVKAAQVRRNSFYEQFTDKRDCFAAAYQIGQERLLGVLTYQCYARASLPERVGNALAAGLELLGSDHALTQLIVVEAPAAGGKIAASHHEWLGRYGRLLRFAAINAPEVSVPSAAVEPAIAGGLLSRVKQLALARETARLPSLCPELVQFVHSFYGSPGEAAPSSQRGRRYGQEPPQPQSSELASVLEPA
jgi:AcrR family transcriptional regulator